MIDAHRQLPFVLTTVFCFLACSLSLSLSLSPPPPPWERLAGVGLVGVGGEDAHTSR